MSSALAPNIYLYFPSSCLCVVAAGAPPLPPRRDSIRGSRDRRAVGASTETMRECQQNDSLADGQGWSPSGSDPQTKLAVPDQAVLQRLECVGPAVLASLKACLVATLPAEEQSRRSLFFGKLAAWLESIGGVWSGIPIWDTSCCCHPLTGVPIFASGPRR